MKQRRKIVVLHLAGQYPLAGVGWQTMHHMVGFDRLGHEVFYVEDSGAPPYDPEQRSLVGDVSYSVGFLGRMMSRFGFGERWSYRNSVDESWYGMSAERVERLYGEADALINLCGASRPVEKHLRCPIRVYVQTDPGYEQIQVVGGDPYTIGLLESHTHHVTYGENLVEPGARIPPGPFEWKATRPPVVPDLWDPRAAGDADAFTTIGTWKNVGKDIEFGGERYHWSKDVNFLRFQDLPVVSKQKFRFALEATGVEDVVESLRGRGWVVEDALPPSRDLDSYQQYIHSSRGEFTVAKDLYVRTGCGWFSDRSACYLAAGKPVVTQETGFSRFLPTGRGLFAFDTLEEARVAIDEINTDYARHCRAAREVAEEHFRADRLLAKLLRDVGL